MSVATRERRESISGGKFLTFKLAEEEYGLEILKIKEIIGYIAVTSVPHTPHYVKGVINLRGKVVPIIDLRSMFNMQKIKYTKETCIIVVDVRGILMGIVVDAVSEVVNIKDSSIENTPTFGTELNTDFILGMGKVNDEVKILLNIDKILSSVEIDKTQKVKIDCDENR